MSDRFCRILSSCILIIWILYLLKVRLIVVILFCFCFSYVCFHFASSDFLSLIILIFLLMHCMIASLVFNISAGFVVTNKLFHILSITSNNIRFYLILNPTFPCLWTDIRSIFKSWFKGVLLKNLTLRT